MYQNNAGGGLQLPMLDMGTDSHAAGIVSELDVDMTSLDMALQAEVNSQNPPPQGGYPPFAPQRQLHDSQAQDDTAMAAEPDASGGPLPTDFRTPNPNTSGSILTEFTKRRNWTQRVLEELRDFLHILDAEGKILFAAPSCQALTGWVPDQLLGRSIGDFIHPDDRDIFTKEFNEAIATGSPLRYFYRFRKTDDDWAVFEVNGHPHLSTNPYDASQPYMCKGFFMMAREYPTKNAALLDSFLEHKIENERLMKRVAELKREEQEELEGQDNHWRSKGDGYSSIAPSETQGHTECDSTAPAAYSAMPPPAKPSISNTALTRQNLDEALASSKPDSIKDKMARYEGSSHEEHIEMLTGLRYRDGERSQGISTGDASPLLIRGDAGIQISVDREVRGSLDRKKKLKVADEYVCTDCGTLDSPEWRKGPNGPKSLCNACGLRWAKKEKRRQSKGQDQSQTQDQNQASAAQASPLAMPSSTNSS